MDLNGQNRFFFYWTRRYGPDLVGGGWGTDWWHRCQGWRSLDLIHFCAMNPQLIIGEMVV
jgi:hypothetical protein